MVNTPIKKTASHFRVFSGDLANCVAAIEKTGAYEYDFLGEDGHIDVGNILEVLMSFMQSIADLADVGTADSHKLYLAQKQLIFEVKDIDHILNTYFIQDGIPPKVAFQHTLDVIGEIKKTLNNIFYTAAWLGVEGSQGTAQESAEIKKRMVLLAHKKQSKWQCFLAYSEILLLCGGDKETAKQLSVVKHATITTPYLEALQQTVTTTSVGQVFSVAKVGEYQKAVLLVQVTQMALAHIARMLKESRAMDHAKEIVVISRGGANEDPRLPTVSQQGFFLEAFTLSKALSEALAPLYEDREVVAPVQAKKQPIPDSIAFEWKRFCLAVRYLCMFRSSEERFLVARLKDEIEEILTSPYSKNALKRTQLSAFIANWRRHYVKRGFDDDIMRDEIVAWGGALMVGLLDM